MKWHHIGLQVTDLKVSASFYKRIFGFAELQYFELPGEKILFLQKDEIKLELIECENPPKLHSNIHFSWKVDNLLTQINDLQEKGLKPIEGPLNLDNGWRVVFYRGLDQEIIELLEATLEES